MSRQQALSKLIQELKTKHPDKTIKEVKSMATSILKKKAERNNQKEFKEQKQSNDTAKRVASSIALAALKSPQFWKLAGSIITKINHPSWYGGESNTFTGPVGPYIQPTPGMSVILANSVVEVSPQNLISFELVSSQWNAAIIAFNRRLGFQSGLTEENISNYLKRSVAYLSAFATMKRMLSSANVPVFKSVKYGDRVHNTGIVGLFETNNYIAGIKGSKDMPLPNFSNYVWNTDYVDTLLTMKLLPHHFELVSYLFDGVFSNGIDSGVNTIIEFMPRIPSKQMESIVSSTSTVKWWEDWLDRAKSDFKTARDANPYIEQFLETIGFGNVIPQEWTQRDPLGMALATVLDPSMINALVNMQNENYEENKIMVSYSSDIDPTFERVFEESSIGEIGSQLKLNIMNGKLVGYQAYMLYRAVAGSTQVTHKWNSPKWSFAITNGEFRVGLTIDTIIRHETGEYATTALNALLSNIKPHQFMGVEEFDFKQYAFSIDEVEGYVDITERSVPTRVNMLGSDVKQVNDLENAIQIIKVNFTLGSEYLTTLSKVVQDAATALTLR